MQTSDLSGTALEGDAPVEVEARLGDGTKRLLTVSASEAATLSVKGQDRSTFRSRSWAFVRRRGGALAKAAVALFVASVVLPALTRQWTDRQAVLQLKQSLVGQISAGSLTAIQEAQDALGNGAGHRTRAARVKSGWISRSASIDPVYLIYFPKSHALRHWNDYSAAVAAYIALVADPPRLTGGDGKVVMDYLGTHAVGPPGPTCQVCNEIPVILEAGPDRVPLESFRTVYLDIGFELLQRQQSLITDVLTTSPRGYSTTWSHFVRDVFFIGH